jgi:hypothetical protein
MFSTYANIIGKSGQLPPPAIDAQTIQQIQSNALALQKQQQDAQAQNALAKLYQNPANVQNGMLTQNALAQVMGIDPATGIALQQQQLKTKDAQVGVASDQQSYLASNVLTPAMEAYQNALKTMPQTAAMQVAQQVYSASLSAAKSSGVFSSDQSDQMPQNFDPNRIGGALESYSDYQKQQEQQSALQQKSDYDDQLLAIDNAKIGITAANDGLNAPGGATLNPSPGTSGANLNPPVTQQDQDDINSLLGPIPASAGGASAGTAQPPQTAPSIKPVPGYSLPATQAMVQQYLTTGKAPNFGGGGIGRRQNEAFMNAVGAAQSAAASPDAKPDPEVMSLAQSMANYQTPPPSDQALGRYPMIAQAWTQAQKLNPSLSAANYPAVAQSLKNFDTGVQGNATRSLNVGIQHLDVLSDAATALGNGDTQKLNSLSQTFEEQFGSSVPTNFDVTKQLVGDEIAKAIVGGPTAQADREKAQDILSRVNSPQQLSGAIGQIKRLMAGQLVGLRQQFTSSTNAPASVFDAKLLPTTVDELNAVSASDNASQPQSVASPPAVGTVMQGYRFNGGDPSDPASWSKV